MTNDQVEKRLTERQIEEGELTLGPAEVQRLMLPAYSGSIEISFEEETFHVDWNSSQRRISGEALGEVLQLHATVNGLVRLHGSGDRYELEVVAGSRLDPAWRSSARSSYASRWGNRPSLFDDDSGELDAAVGGAVRQRAPIEVDRYRLRDASEYQWHGGVGIHRATIESFVDNIDGHGWDDPEFFELRLEGEDLNAVSDFDELMALDVSNIDHMPHQEKTALKVLGPAMRGRAVLADEVGLGKTIEAGLIIKELAMRGMVNSILILCPASLREQWQEELKQKFDLDFSVLQRGTDGIDDSQIIMSIDLGARRSEELLEYQWDLVVVDEAHKLAGNAKKRQALVRGLEPRYMLFLSATPVQNNLIELYRLVDLLRPGTFTSERDFKRRYVDPDDKRRPKDPAALRRLVSDVMVRTTRAQAGVDRVERYAVDLPVTLSEPERRAYDLVTTTLRTEMNGRDDALRRRHLAHRLTLSPRALALTARKVAATHPNPRVAKMLEPLADLCIDFEITNRQKTLLDLTSQWISERASDDPASKGKVLVFTHQSDSLDDLLRIYAEAGVEAVPFHGGLSPSKKRESIENFRASAAVMVSTESGAEGLNLQFANCVVNYDLPWNPMRIEQRIGRVHRLTQPRNVYVANLYARDTVDQHVYDILRDKLKMFELLFGQVTTILGELDDRDGAATFEQRVLNALLARSDTAMHAEFRKLGAEVAKAKKAADQMMTVGGHLDWADGATWREELAGDADELRPQIELKARQRRESAERFTRRVLELIGAEITYEGNSAGHGNEVIAEEQFLTAELPPEAAEEFGRDRLHLAFSSAALANHADAELCTVGSEFFDELLFAIRERGDLLARWPSTRPEDVITIAHDDSATLVARTILGPVTYGIEATWRVRDPSGGFGERLVTTFVGDRSTLDDADDLPAASDGDELPATAPATRELLERVVKESLSQLEDVRSEAQGVADDRADAERSRMSTYLDEQLEQREIELHGAYSPTRIREIEEAMEQLESLKARIDAASEERVEVRADLLALKVVGSRRVRVHETWRNRRGREIDLVHNWSPGEPVILMDPTDDPIARLAVCTEGHAHNSGGRETCSCCDRDLCPFCSGEFAFRPCGLCERHLCGECVPDVGELCPACTNATRDPQLDTLDGLLGWRLASGLEVRVGPEIAVVAGVEDERYFASQALIAGSRPAELARLLAALDLRPDIGLRVIGADQREVEASDEVPLGSTTSWSAHMEPSGGSKVDPLPLSAPLPAASSRIRQLDKCSRPAERLFSRLRNAEPPRKPPSLVLTETRIDVSVELGPEGFTRVERIRVGAQPDRLVRTPVGLSWQDDEAAATARCDNATITVVPLHRSYVATVVTADSVRRYFIPPGDAPDAESEASLARMSDAMGPLRSTFAIAASEALRNDYAEPSAATLEHREVSAGWTLVPTGDIQRWATADDLGLTGVGRSASAWDGIVPSAYDHVASLDPTAPDQPVLVRLHRIVEERWRGAGTAERRYVVEPGDPPHPPLDDTGEPESDFGVDHEGHLHQPSQAWTCPACERVRCRACAEAGDLEPCTSCGQPACGDCRHRTTPIDVSAATCAECRAAPCGRCGRDPRAVECAMCGRDICAGCWERSGSAPGSICRQCGDVERAPGLDTTDGLVGWRSRSGVDVAIGRSYARITRRDGIRHVFTQIEPGRRQLASVSTSLGCRFDIGLRVESVPIDIEQPTGVEVAYRERRWMWSVDPAGGSEIRGPIGHALAGLGEAGDERMESASDEVALLELLERLRSLDPPAPAPALVRTETSSISWIELDDEGPVEVVRSVSGDRDPIEQRHRLELVPVDGEVIARAAWSGGTVEVRPLHRSYVLTASTSQASTTWFIGEQGADERDEHALHEVALRLDGARHHLALGPEVDLDEEFATPSEATLVTRQVRPLWGPVPDAPFLRWAVPADLDVLASDDAPAPRGGPRVLEHLIGLDRDRPSAPTVLLQSRLVHETWQGDGEATIEYVVPPGARPLPHLDDSGSASADFGVDNAGHLHEVGASWRCEACRHSRCGACGDDGRLEPCSDCLQEACGSCRRATHASVSTRACERCTRRPCISCGHDPRAQRCVVCERWACEDCWDEGSGTCATCARVTPADDAIELPQELHAEGCAILASSDATTTVVAILGAMRREVAIITNGEIAAWWSLADRLPSSVELLLGRQHLASGNVEVQVRRGRDPLQPAEDWFVVDEVIAPSAMWELFGPGDDTPIARGGPSDVPFLADSQEILAAMSPPMALLPAHPAPHIRPHLERIAPIARIAPTGRLLVRQFDVRSRDVITTGGVSSLRLEAEGYVVSTSEWAPPSGRCAPLVPSCDPPIAPIVESATQHGFEAVLAHWRGSTFVIVGSAAGAGECLMLQPSPAFPHSVELAVAIGDSSGSIAVSAFVTPQSHGGPTLRNAGLRTRSYQALPLEPSGPPSPEATAAAAAAWATEKSVGPTMSERQVPPTARDALHASLASRFALPLARVVDLGALVSERWHSAYGDIDVSYEVRPDRGFDGIDVVDQPERVTSATVDRSHHLVHEPRTCLYCTDVVCDRCDDGVAPCSLCAISICRRCTGSNPSSDPYSHMCPACRNLERPGRWAARRAAAHAMVKGKVLTGADDNHEVIVVIDGSSVVVTSQGQHSRDTRHEVGVELAALVNAAYGKAVAKVEGPR